jgi:hypothetical protein
MTDFTTVSPGSPIGSNAPGLPPIDLAQVPPPRQPLRVTVGPKPAGHPDGVWGASLEEFKPSAEASPDHIDGAWGSSLPEHSAETEKEAKKNYRDVSTGEAFARSAGQGASFGLEPAIEGVVAAGQKGNPDLVNPEIRDTLKKYGLEPTDPLGSLTALVRGLGKLGYEHLIAPATGEGTKEYQRAREEAQAALEAGREQHPYASFAGEMTGALAVPVPGLAAAAAPARIARGAAFGAAGGAAYGAGSGVSEGKDTAGIAKKAIVGGALGTVTGGAFGGALGPRVPATVPTRGERAAETARDLGKYLPRGVASDKPMVQSGTAALRQLPVVGPRIGSAVADVEEAAGKRIGDIATEMTGGATDRAAADAIVRPGLQHVLDSNKAAIDAAYSGVRNAIDQNKHFTMPRTQQVLSAVMRQRRAAGSDNPGQGLDELINVSNGATFNGAHERRALARRAGNVLQPHPGYDKAQFNRIIGAMGADLRDMAAAATLGTKGQPATRAQQARTVRDFNQAEAEFQRLAKQDDALHNLIDAKGEASIATLMGNANAKGGNVAQLAQLRASMKPEDFQQVGGVLLAELGQRGRDFSLAQFQSNFEKLAPRAKAILFSPAHLKNIEDIAEMGLHIKKALKESSSSHSNGMIVMLDVAKDAALIGADLATGGLAGLGAKTLIGAGTTVALYTLARWLGNPAKASSMASWNRARIGLLASPTPARLGAFNIATRNLSNNLGVPVESLAKHLTVAQPPQGGRAQDDQPK